MENLIKDSESEQQQLTPGLQLRLQQLCWVNTITTTAALVRAHNKTLQRPRVYSEDLLNIHTAADAHIWPSGKKQQAAGMDALTHLIWRGGPVRLWRREKRSVSTVFTASSPRGCLFADVAVGGGKHADSSTSCCWLWLWWRRRMTSQKSAWSLPGHECLSCVN